MHIVKSLHAGVLYRSFSVQGKHLFSAAALWAFRLDNGKPWLEKDFWSVLAGELEAGQVLDASMPKACGEFLVAGSFFAPGDTPLEAGKVSVRLGNVEKTLIVHGDRYWQPFLSGERGIAGPKPMTKMPIAWKHAFGGEGYPHNPTGKGADKIQQDGVELFPLPNVEYPNALVTSMKSRPPPASLGPVPLEWPQRTRLAGTYDEHYLKTRMPGLADDVDWHFFNAATPDQWCPDEEFWRGDETFEIHFMHPDWHHLRGQLPAVRGRCFIRRQIDKGMAFEELPTRIDTVWLLPACNMGVIIHRGCCEIGSDDASDVPALMIAHENSADTARSRAHYEEQMRLRTDPQESFKYLLNTGPLIPDGCTCGFEEIKATTEFPLDMLVKQNSDNFLARQQADANQKKEEQMAAMHAKLVAAGVDADAIFNQLKTASEEENPIAIQIRALLEKVSPGLSTGKPIDFTRLDLKAMDALNAFLDQIAAQKREEALSVAAKEIERLKHLATDPQTQAAALKLEQQLLELKLPPRLPRTTQLEQWPQMQQQMATFQGDIDALAHQGADAELIKKMQASLGSVQERMVQVQSDVMEGYRQGAHMIPLSRSPHEGAEPGLRKKIEAAVAKRGTYVAGMPATRLLQTDFAFVDLSGLDLRGFDFSSTYLEYVNFTHADVRGVNFSGAILAHAVFAETKASGANFTKANLGATQLSASLFDECLMEGVILGRANITRCSFRGARFTASPATFLETMFASVDFSDADLPQQTFLERDLRACCFNGANLTESFFVKSCLDSAQFVGATLTSINFVELSAQKADFSEANMHNVRFVAGCALMNSRFCGATITGANLREVDGRDSDFRGACLNASDCSGIRLVNAQLSGMTAIQTQFNKADLTGAQAAGANLLGAGFMQAQLTGTNFTGANLYSANFLSATLGNTLFAEANLDQTILKDWRPA